MQWRSKEGPDDPGRQFLGDGILLIKINFHEQYTFKLFLLENPTRDLKTWKSGKRN